eukprot:12898728-Prorocentrum_lima.AAC.1
MELSIVLTQIWLTVLPIDENKRRCRFATHSALSVAKPDPPDPVVQVQTVSDLFKEKLGSKMHPGEASRWLRQQGQ